MPPWQPIPNDDAIRGLLNDRATQAEGSEQIMVDENLIALIELGRLEAGTLNGERKYRTTLGQLSKHQFQKSQKKLTNPIVEDALNRAILRVTGKGQHTL